MLGLADPKRIWSDPFLTRHATAAQAERRIDVMWMVAIAKFKGASKDAHGIVEGLPAAAVRIGHASQGHVIDAQEGKGADPRTPK